MPKPPSDKTIVTLRLPPDLLATLEAMVADPDTKGVKSRTDAAVELMYRGVAAGGVDLGAILAAIARAGAGLELIVEAVDKLKGATDSARTAKLSRTLSEAKAKKATKKRR